MSLVQVQFAPWDKIHHFKSANLNLRPGELVIVETELGQELGTVVSCSDSSLVTENLQEEDMGSILRHASLSDQEKIVSVAKKEEALKYCRLAINRLGLEMKLVDVHFSWEGNKINFAFIAEGRVDFRDLVKDLAAHFGASIRLTQIGTRDEAKLSGDCGPCGRVLCCRSFLCEFSSISSEMAEIQQVVYRGSDRISGPCGRLMCCLSYENKAYLELIKKLPPINSKIKVNGRIGLVCAHNILKQTVNLRILSDNEEERDVIIEYDLQINKQDKVEKKGKTKQLRNK